MGVCCAFTAMPQGAAVAYTGPTAPPVGYYTNAAGSPTSSPRCATFGGTIPAYQAEKVCVTDAPGGIELVYSGYGAGAHTVDVVAYGEGPDSQADGFYQQPQTITWNGASNAADPAFMTLTDNTWGGYAFQPLVYNDAGQSSTDFIYNIHGSPQPIAGGAPFYGSLGDVRLNKPIVGMAVTPDGRGYWLVASDGGVFNFGDAGFYGSLGNIRLNKPIVGMAATPDGKGYMLVASDGGIFPFGDAPFGGSLAAEDLTAPAVAVTLGRDNESYLITQSDGTVTAIGAGASSGGGASSYGDRGVPAGTKIVGLTPTADGIGYWLIGADGGVYPEGDATAYGSLAGTHLNKPIVAAATIVDGFGLWLASSDGGIFQRGYAGYYGGLGNVRLNEPIVGMAASPDGHSYWLVASDGGVFPEG
jgi:hypothetical protein